MMRVNIYSSGILVGLGFLLSLFPSASMAYFQNIQSVSQSVDNCRMTVVNGNVYEVTFRIHYWSSATSEKVIPRYPAVRPYVYDSNGRLARIEGSNVSNVVPTGAATSFGNYSPLTLGTTAYNLRVLTNVVAVTYSFRYSMSTYPYPGIAFRPATVDYGIESGVTSYSTIGGNVIYSITPGSNVCVSSTGTTNPPPPPPRPVIEPEFKLGTAVWELNTVDLSELPDVTDASDGFIATIKNVNSNNLCLTYATEGVKNKEYALRISNVPGTINGRSLYTLSGPNNSSLLFNLLLTSNELGRSFSFPASSTEYISLSQTANSGGTGRSQMCWSPRINLFKNASSKAGMHQETLNFIITPRA